MLQEYIFGFTSENFCKMSISKILIRFLAQKRSIIRSILAAMHNGISQKISDCKWIPHVIWFNFKDVSNIFIQWSKWVIEFLKQNLIYFFNLLCNEFSWFWSPFFSALSAWKSFYYCSQCIQLSCRLDF